jgi:hypothetical protein
MRATVRGCSGQPSDPSVLKAFTRPLLHASTVSRI